MLIQVRVQRGNPLGPPTPTEKVGRGPLAKVKHKHTHTQTDAETSNDHVNKVIR